LALTFHITQVSRWVNLLNPVYKSGTVILVMHFDVCIYIYIFCLRRTCELWCGQSNGSISIFTIHENVVTSQDIVNHYEPMIENINVLNLVSTHCPLYHEGDDITVCSYVYPGKASVWLLCYGQTQARSWSRTSWLQLKLFTFSTFCVFCRTLQCSYCNKMQIAISVHLVFYLNYRVLHPVARNINCK
jgi:hypothetical protein